MADDITMPGSEYVPTPESSGFVVGYSTCHQLFDAHPAELPFNPTNPFREGTDQWRGFEEAVYDFTQK